MKSRLIAVALLLVLISSQLLPMGEKEIDNWDNGEKVRRRLSCKNVSDDESTRPSREWVNDGKRNYKVMFGDDEIKILPIDPNDGYGGMVQWTNVDHVNCLKEFKNLILYEGKWEDGSKKKVFTGNCK